MNVLLTCAGGRSYFVDALKAALRCEGEVYACDSTADAPALQQADKAFLVPEVTDRWYIDALIRICVEHRVRLVVPCLEPELRVLAASRARFDAVRTILAVSTPHVVDTCYDKLRTGEFLTCCGLASPRCYATLESALEALARGDLSFPLVLKPRWGVGSLGLSFPEDRDELELGYRVTRRQIARSSLAEISATDPARCIVIQQSLDGTEYGLDVVNDLEARYVCTFVRRKLRMRAGQTDRAVTVDDSRLAAVGEVIGTRLGHVGPLDCDVMLTDTGCFVLDLNPRVGGGYPFSHLAGARIPEALIGWARGEAVDPSCFRVMPDIVGARYDAFAALGRDKAIPAVRIEPLDAVAAALCTAQHK